MNLKPHLICKELKNTTIYISMKRDIKKKRSRMKICIVCGCGHVAMTLGLAPAGNGYDATLLNIKETVANDIKEF